MGVVSAPKLSTLSRVSSGGAVTFLGRMGPSTIVVLFAGDVTRSAFAVLRSFRGSKASTFSLAPLGTVNMLTGISAV